MRDVGVSRKVFKVGVEEVDKTLYSQNNIPRKGGTPMRRIDNLATRIGSEELHYDDTPDRAFLRHKWKYRKFSSGPALGRGESSRPVTGF
jgi:hypothetical protein